MKQIVNFSGVSPNVSDLEPSGGVLLKEHQLRVAEKLKNQRGLLAYHGLGSGKTLTGINAAEQYGGATVVLPAKLRPNFDKELQKYGAKGKYDIYSYEKFVKDRPNLTDKFLLLDEAHKIRSSSAERTKAILEQSKAAKKVLMLTGTPIQNKPHEISPLINTITGEKTLPTDEKEFNSQYINKNKIFPNFIDRLKGAKPGSKLNATNLDDYYSKTSQYVDYYSPDISNSKDFPKVNTKYIDVPMNNEQIKLYKEYSGKLSPDLLFKMKNSLPPSAQDSSNLNAFINVNRQASNTARSYNTLATEPSPKIDKVINSLETSKVPSVVYSNYLRSGLDELESELDRRQIKYGRISGNTKDIELRNVVNNYNKGKLKTLLLSSAGGEGLDLKGTRQVHILEPHWNEDKIKQVIGRSARYKSHSHLPEQDRNVEVYRYNSVFPQPKISKYLPMFRNNDITADEYLTKLSQQKSSLNKQFTERWEQ